MKRPLWLLATLATLIVVFLAGVVVGQNKFNEPTTVLHVVTVKWKADSTAAQRQQALQGIREMAAQVPGIKNIWLKADRVQPQEFSTAFAIEFESRAAADAYAKHPAHDAWYKVYLPVREESRSLQMTNPLEPMAVSQGSEKNE